MRVNRKLLYLGVFLFAIGGVLVAADLGGAEAPTIRDALQLWPLAIVAIGLGIALRQTRFSLPSGVLAAAVPGLILGGGFALAPRMAIDCGADGVPSTVVTDQGVFDAPALVSISTGCGSLTVDTAAGNEWRFERSDLRGRAPNIDSSPHLLSIEARGHRWWQRVADDRDTWHLTLPTSPIEDLSFVLNAGQGRMALPDARIGSLDITTNAGSTTVDLSEASVTNLSGIVNAGMLSFKLPAADLSGSMQVNAGSVQICAPADIGLRVRHESNLGGFAVNGQHQTGSEWQSPNYASAIHTADIDFDVNLGSVEINPIGGCK